MVQKTKNKVGNKQSREFEAWVGRNFDIKKDISFSKPSDFIADLGGGIEELIIAAYKRKGIWDSWSPSAWPPQKAKITITIELIKNDAHDGNVINNM